MVVKFCMFAFFNASTTLMYLLVTGCLANLSLSGRCKVNPPLGPPQKGILEIISTSLSDIPTAVVNTDTGCPCSCAYCNIKEQFLFNQGSVKPEKVILTSLGNLSITILKFSKDIVLS